MEPVSKNPSKEDVGLSATPPSASQNPAPKDSTNTEELEKTLSQNGDDTTDKDQRSDNITEVQKEATASPVDTFNSEESNALRASRMENAALSNHARDMRGNMTHIHITTAHIGGDVTGNKYGDTKSSVRAGHVLKIITDDLEKLRKIYVKTSIYNEALNVLKAKNVVILQGEPNTGKWCTALNLLMELHKGEIFEANLPLEDVGNFETEKERAYVIHAFDLKEAELLKGSALRTLSWNLSKDNKRSYVVITVDSLTSTLAQVSGDYLKSWRSLGNAEELMLRHLEWYISDSEQLERSKTVVGHDLFRTLQREKTLLPRDIEKLAQIIARSIANGDSAEEALETFRKNTTSLYYDWNSTISNDQFPAMASVRQWFQTHPNFQQQLWMVTMGALNGCSQSDIRQARTRLQEKCQIPMAPSTSATEGETKTVFDVSFSEILKDLDARPVVENVLTEYGLTPVTTITLNDEEFRRAILPYVWNELPDLQEPLLEWLYELGFEAPSILAYRVAVSTGELSRFAFKAVCDHVIRPWANSRETSVRRLVSTVFSAAIVNDDAAPNVAPQILRLLHVWSTVDNSRLRWSAATAYGGTVGLAYPSIALPDLFKISQEASEQGGIETLLCVSRSMVNLFNTIATTFDVEDEFVIVCFHLWLNALDDWTHPRQNSRTALTNGTFVLWAVMKSTQIEVGEQKHTWPTLLWLYNTDAECQTLIWELVRRALNVSQIRNAIRHQLHEWVVFADDSRRFFKPVAKILFQLATGGTPNECDRILNYLSRWAAEGSSTAGRIEKIVREEKRRLQAGETS